VLLDVQQDLGTRTNDGASIKDRADCDRRAGFVRGLRTSSLRSLLTEASADQRHGCVALMTRGVRYLRSLSGTSVAGEELANSVEILEDR